MKTILSILFSLTVCLAFGQDTTYTLPDSQFGWHNIDRKSWAIAIVPDTLDASSDDDTVVINLPHKLGTYFTALLEVTMDTTTLTADLEGTYEVRTAQCATCPYTTVETVTIPNVDVYTRDTFDVDNIMMQIRIIGTSGVGTCPSWITLKPKGASW